MIRGVEHEADALVTQFFDGGRRQLGEHTATLRVGMGGGVDGSNGADGAVVATTELPTEEHAHPDDAVAVGRDPGRRGPEGIGAVLPMEERIVICVACPPERLAEQVEDRWVVRQLCSPDLEPGAHGRFAASVE